jgi:siderophore synthetase component
MIRLDPDADRAYISRRIIDCCLRENLRDIARTGQEATPPPSVKQLWGTRDEPPAWWRIAHWPGGTLWLPVRRSDYMQCVSALSDAWIRQTASGAQLEYGFEAWLSLLAEGLDKETQLLHRRYVDEATLAAAHRALAREAYRQHASHLARALDHPDWGERLLRADQVASYRDHPFYPTARAKTGLDENALRAFAPEFNPSFELHWLAVPRQQITRSTAAPAFWPRMGDLGFDQVLDDTHVAWPVHPLTWSRLHELALPDGSLRSANTFLHVRPTLSVRTVVPVEHPRHHLKLPLLMYTLGALSLRMIRPSSLYDGVWFQRVLTTISRHDAHLRDRYLHVDETHYGHVADSRHLSYLMRVYPASTAPDCLVPVAALCAAMPDGRTLAAHLVERYYGGDTLAWWREYLDLLCGVHLRLWLVYGIALEANQQNAVLIYRENSPLRLLMKDNDAGRVWTARLRTSLRALEGAGPDGFDLDDFGPLHNERILVREESALGQMFCTITVQLNLLAILEGLSDHDESLRHAMYDALRQGITVALQDLRRQGVDTGPADTLFGAPTLPVKYLLSAGSLLSKQTTGAADIQKFYGASAPNFMLTRHDAAMPTDIAHHAGNAG